MTAPRPASDDPLAREAGDFSLVLGGPLYQLFVRGRMISPPLGLLHRRMLLLAGIAWLPLVVLTLAGGVAWGGVRVPVLHDLEAHVRFLVSVPLMVAAELIVHQRIRTVVAQFGERGLISPQDQTRFDGAIANAMRLRNSIVAEVVLLALAFGFGHWLWREHIALSVATWYAEPTEAGIRLTTPGYWYAFVSLQVFRFIMLRWLFRLVVWYRFLWQVSRIPLRLNPLHPDRAGGLGFLAASVFAFAPVLLAHTVLLSAIVADRIWHEGARLPQFRIEIAAIMITLLLAVLGPQMFFILQLGQARRAGLREYGSLASRYVREFHRKWMEGGLSGGDSLLGSGDIQSLADLGNSFEVVREMGLLPFGRQTVIRLAILIALPLLPLTLTMIPLEDLLDRAFGLFL